jgi:hypothetical protein
MVRFDMKKGAYVRMKLVEKMIDHMDIPSSIIPKAGKTELRMNSHRSKIWGLTLDFQGFLYPRARPWTSFLHSRFIFVFRNN